MSDVAYMLLPTVTVSNGTITACNEVFTDVIGFTQHEIVGMELQDILSIVDDNKHSRLSAEQLFSYCSESKQGTLVSATITDKHYYKLPVKVYCQCCEGAKDTYTLSFRVLENKSIDPITGLPNGWAIRSKGDYLLSLPDIDKNNMALIILSVDNFSTMNFRYGFDVGDNFLLVLGKKLQQTVKKDGLVVRYSNAKFGVLVEDGNELSTEAFHANVARLCQRLCQIAAKPLELDQGLRVGKSFSIGASSESAAYESYHAMEVAAETAMREAKKYSVSKYCFATEETTGDLIHNKLIIDEFPHAIEQSQIKIHYQPQYELSSGKLIGFEALSRWTHKELGNIAPDVFVGIAEEIGLHFEFDLWVFNQVCSQLVDWQQQGLNIPRIAINISFKTLEMTTFISRITDIIASTMCPTALIEIEITETANAKNIKILSDNIAQTKKLGIHIAVDDFGTGYSSLNLIRTYRHSLDKLKLDRTLIENICNTTLDREFTRQIIDLSTVLDVKVLAEGVETLEQRDLLTQLGCDYAQGYYFNRPLTKQDTEQLIRDGMREVVVAAP